MPPMTLDSPSSNLLVTPLWSVHQGLGGKLTPFAGWDMPLQYQRVFDEHAMVRQSAGLFDVSHMGIVSFQGLSVEATLSFLDTLVPRDLQKRLTPGKAVYTQLLAEDGGILDDIILYRLNDDPEPILFPGISPIFMVCNAANTETDLQWIRSHIPQTSPLTLHTMNQSFGLLALQGPAFQLVLNHANGGESPTVPSKRFRVTTSTLDNTPVIIARTGYTGEDGVEMIVPNQALEPLWAKLLSVGKDTVIPIGLAARDTLRLEAGLPLHGQDITPQYTPLETGLAWSVDLDKSTSYVGQRALQQQKSEGIPHQVFCFKLLKNTIPRHDDPLRLPNGTRGIVTSGAMSPTLDAPIGMGIVKSDAPLTPGMTIIHEGRRGDSEAILVERPFYRPAK